MVGTKSQKINSKDFLNILIKTIKPETIRNLFIISFPNIYWL